MDKRFKVTETKHGNTTTIDIDPGDVVLCDGCNKDFTDSDERGGIYGFGSKAIGPCCARKWIESAEEYDELHHIKAVNEHKSFADWVREDLR